MPSGIPVINVHFTTRRGLACEVVVFPDRRHVDRIPTGVSYELALERAMIAA